MYGSSAGGIGCVNFTSTRVSYSFVSGPTIGVAVADIVDEPVLYGGYKTPVKGFDFSTDSFDVVVSTGVLTVGHAPPGSFDELVRITKPDGYIVFTLQTEAYKSHGFKEKLEELESDGKWKLAEISEEYQPLPKGEPEVLHRIWVYQVIS